MAASVWNIFVQFMGSNGIKTQLFIFTDGANFAGTSNEPDVIRTEGN
jgi:hypothetical protein